MIIQKLQKKNNNVIAVKMINILMIVDPNIQQTMLVFNQEIMTIVTDKKNNNNNKMTLNYKINNIAIFVI